MKMSYNLVKNFSPDAPLWKKILGNVIFFIGNTKVRSRPNLRALKEYPRIKKMLQKGDILLLGQREKVSGYIIPGIVTHTALYIGNHTCIHALGQGVEKEKLKKTLYPFDTLIILRPRFSKKKKQSIIRAAISYATKQVGKPFNYLLEKGTQQYCCTQLIKTAFDHAGYDCKIPKGSIPLLDTQMINFSAGKPPLPSDFLKGNFDIIYLSNNLFKDKQGTIVHKPKETI
jgi:hypothetical protein